MKHIWFKKIAYFYQPISWTGVLLTLIFILCLVNIFILVDMKSHSISDTLYGILPYYVLIFLFFWLLARKTSKP